MTRAPAAAGASFADTVWQWQQAHGRSQLPWQATRDPYRVWLSEVMLQQTQVSTVLSYYARFLERFPDVASLAAAHEDEVFGLWSGLGYYSRARNLHRCAQAVMREHGGAFPRSAAQLEALPGIGRSTAAAIAAFCWDERVAILDGNVKRVLTRVLAFDGDLARPAAVQALWDAATRLLPEQPARMPGYTQGLMDLGATICGARKPNCLLCPVQATCAGRASGSPERFPVKTRRVARTSVSLWLLRAQREDGAVWLEKRPSPGVWAGLHCLPAFDSREALQTALPAVHVGEPEDEPVFLHVLTHRDLYLHPVRVVAPVSSPALRDRQGAWFTPQDWPALGLPAPVRRLLAAT